MSSLDKQHRLTQIPNSFEFHEARVVIGLPFVETV